MFMSAFPRKSYVRNRFYAFICIKMHINGSGEEIWDQKGNHVN